MADHTCTPFVEPAVFWIAAVVMFTSGPALADGAAVLRCRQITDPPQRLICYDAMAVPVSATVAQAPLLAPAPPPQAASFGLEVKAALVGLPSTMESTVPGRFLGWGPNDKITLANGQIWQISDDSRGALVSTDPRVTVRRGALGAFYLEVAGTNRSPKVRRLQ